MGVFYQVEAFSDNLLAILELRIDFETINNKSERVNKQTYQSI